MSENGEMEAHADDTHYDFVIVGSGFGGSVSAMRLAQKGYRVLVLERGKRYGAGDFPKTNWDIRKYLWLPTLRCFGILGIHFLDDIMVLNGSGVGEGSRMYAGTNLEPRDSFYLVECFINKVKPYRRVFSRFEALSQRQLAQDNRPACTGGRR